MLTSALRRLRRHRATRTRGQSLVEFALILPVFMLFFATTLDLGRLAMAQLSVANAAREGAFQASTTPAANFNNTLPCPTDGASNLVVCRVLLEAKSSGVTISHGDISLTCSVAGCPTGLGNRVTVSVAGHFQLLTPILAGFFNGSQSITFTKSATTQIETLPPAAVVAPGPTPSPTPTPHPGHTPGPTATPAPTSTVCSSPSAGFTQTTTPPTNQSPVTITVTDTSTSPNCSITSWQWTWGDNTTSSGQTPGSHTYLVAGTYDVTLTVTNSVDFNTTGAIQVEVK